MFITVLSLLGIQYISYLEKLHTVWFYHITESKVQWHDLGVENLIYHFSGPNWQTQEHDQNVYLELGCKCWGHSSVQLKPTSFLIH